MVKLIDGYGANLTSNIVVKQNNFYSSLSCEGGVLWGWGAGKSMQL